MSAVNGTLDKNSCRLGEKFIFTFDKGKHLGVVNVSYEGISYLISIGDMVIYAPDLTKYYGGPSRFTLKAIMPEKPASGKIVSFELNGKKYYRSTDDEGMASLSINLNVGSYDIISEIEGLKVKSTITVKPTVQANNVVKMFRNATQYYATFLDSDGFILKNTDVKFNINGVFYTRTTNESDVAKLNINLNPATYILTAENPVTGELHSSNVTVLSLIVENHDLIKYYKNESKYTLRVLDDKGNPSGEGVLVK